MTHVGAVVTVALAASLVSRYPSPWLVFPFFALVFGPGVLWNAVFHLGASLRSRAYCPGTVMGLLLYLPLAATLSIAALCDGLLSMGAFVTALVLSAVVQAVEVGHNVFKRW